MGPSDQPGLVEEFRVEFHEWCRRLPNKGLFFSLLAAWLLLFHFLGNSTFGYVDTPSLLHWMWNAYDSGDRSEEHGKLVPLVVLVLFWWKRKELLALPLGLWWPGLAIVALGLGLHLLGYLVQQPRISIVGLFTGVYGLMGAAWGWRFLWASLFPFFLFGFCIPLGSLAENLTFPLRMLVTHISVGLSQGIGFDVLREGSLIYDAQRTFRYDVAPACSGIRSLVALLALTTIFGFISFKTTWRRLAMVVAAFPLAVLGNVVRISFTIFVSELFGQDAGVFVEQKFGFVTFGVAIGCVLLLGRWLREPELASPATATVEAQAT